MSKRILIADGEKSVRNMMRDALEQDGWDVREAGDGNEALAAALQIQPELMIIEAGLPGKPGFEVYQELKKSPEASSIFIIFLCASEDEKAEINKKLNGWGEFLLKPIIPGELKQRVKMVLKFL